MIFKSVRRYFSHYQTISANAEEVFPLFCPVRSYEWIEDWDAILIYSKSGYAEQGCVFKTFDPDDGEDIWIISEYNPPSFIKFIKFNNLRTIIYKISFVNTKNNLCKIIYDQEITGLNEKGNEFVADLEKSDFTEMIDFLESLLNSYIACFKFRTKNSSLH
ncbi:MAG: hypothetical protein RBR08_07380 [Desulforegulaceae bacterium]|nr:hypothetical protein [Desulforegulaceae bacterium]